MFPLTFDMPLVGLQLFTPQSLTIAGLCCSCPLLEYSVYCNNESRHPHLSCHVHRFNQTRTLICNLDPTKCNLLVYLYSTLSINSPHTTQMLLAKRNSRSPLDNFCSYSKTSCYTMTIFKGYNDHYTCLEVFFC